MRAMVGQLVAAEDPCSIVDAYIRPWTGTHDTRIRIDQTVEKDRPSWFRSEWQEKGNLMVFGFNAEVHKTIISALEAQISDWIDEDRSNPRKEGELSRLFNAYAAITGELHRHDPERLKTDES